MRYSILCFLILLISPLFSQEKVSSFYFEDASLKEVLVKLETQFDVRFSYPVDIGCNSSFSFEISNASLDHIMDRLRQEGQLIFEKISRRYIIVKECELNNEITIKGRLIDKITQVPLEGGTIINKKQNKGCTSNKEGYFELQGNMLHDTICVQYIGYTPIQFRAKRIRHNSPIKLELTESSEQLNEVLIDQISDRARDNCDGSIHFSSKDIKSVSASPQPEVFKSLQLLPGVISPSESNTDLYIRGGTPDQNLILWNGITIYQNSHFFGMISALNPNQIEQVKVFRSGASPQYGNRIAGVVDLQSDRSIPQKLGGSLGVNFNYTDALLKLPIKKNKIGLNLSFRRSYNDFIKTPTFNHYSDLIFQNINQAKNNVLALSNEETNFEFYFKDLALNTTINLSDDQKLYVNYLYSINDLDYVFSIDDYYKCTDQLRVHNYGLSLISEGRWSRNFKHRLKSHYTYYNLDYSFRGEFMSEDEEIQRVKKNAIKELGVDADIQVRLNSYSKIRTGLQFELQRVDYLFEEITDVVEYNYIDENNGKENSFALYTELQLNNRKQSYLNLGLRVNHLSTKRRFFFEPRLSAQLKLAESFYFKLAASIKNQNISQILDYETSDFILSNQIWGLADHLSIPILESKQISGGIETRMSGWKCHFETYFKYDEGMTSISKAFINTNSNSDNNLYYSEGENKTWGTDVSTRKSGEDYDILLAYSLIRSNYKFPDWNEGKAFRGNFDIRHALTAAFTYRWQSFECSLNWKWRTGKPYSQVDSVDSDYGQFEYSGINTRQLPNYHRLDLSSAYTFTLSGIDNKQVKLGITLQNLYNRKNVLDIMYVLSKETEYQVSQVGMYSMGITPNLFVRMKF